VQPIRRDLRFLVGDGVAWAMMTGAAEWQFVFFALAIGMGEVASGLLATIPMFLGAVLQLVTPWGARRIGSLRRWTWICAGVQTASLLPLVIGAWIGSMPAWLLYATISLYWASGYMTGPTWQTWFTTLVPRRIRSMFWARRSIWIQGALGLGLTAALILQTGKDMGRPLEAFAIVFGIAAVARGVSAWCLRSQSEPRPELAAAIEPPTPAVLRRFLAEPRTRGLLAYMLAFYFCLFVTGPFFVPYMREHVGLEYWQIMCIQLGTFGSKVLFMPFVGRMVKRLGPGRVLWIGALATTPAAIFWVFTEPWWLLVILQVYVGFGWACWENGSFLLTFDTIPEDRRTPIMTVYQLALATAMVTGSLVGGAILEIFGTDAVAVVGDSPVVAGYVAIFVLTSGMRIVSLFMLASIEPSGLKIRHRARRVLVWTVGAIPGMPGGGIESAIDEKIDPGSDRD
ncbi:MAG: MFS transporter, partial [Phycisphaera sp.]|nr:MFS transporter [Phycisphaera sp.]